MESSLNRSIGGLECPCLSWNRDTTNQSRNKYGSVQPEDRPTKIFGFADFHGRIDVANRASHLILDEHPDAVVVAGDLANRDAQTAKKIIGKLSKANTRVFFVPGNMDSPVLVNRVDTDRITCLHGKKTIHVGVCFLGLGGAIAGAFRAPFEFSEAEARRTLACAIGPGSSHPVTLVSHCPPKDTSVDMAFGGRHVGSEAVREFIEEKEPVLVICGHIHEAQGIDEIGQTMAVNVGAAAHGHYASISVEEQVKIELRRL